MSLMWHCVAITGAAAFTAGYLVGALAEKRANRCKHDWELVAKDDIQSIITKGRVGYHWTYQCRICHDCKTVKAGL